MTGSQYFQVFGEPAGPLPHSDPLFKELGILKIEDIFKLNIANFVYLTLAHESPAIFTDWFFLSSLVHNHATRDNTDVVQGNFFDVGFVESTWTLHTSGSHLVNYGAKLIKVYGPVLWNSFPSYIHHSTSIKSFIFKLKTHLIENYSTEV